MNDIVDHVARLTEHRERGLLDLTLARALMDLAAPASVALLAEKRPWGCPRRPQQLNAHFGPGSWHARPALTGRDH